MTILLSLALFLLFVGHIWMAFELWRAEELLMGFLILIIPMPLLGLFGWYRTGWDPNLRVPAIFTSSATCL